MSKLNIEQFPDEDVTVIEGTRYSNALFRTLGQGGIARGPFVIESREGGVVTMRTISSWPEEPVTGSTGDGLTKLRAIERDAPSPPPPPDDVPFKRI